MPGVVLTTLADRPELVEGVHAVAIDAFRDIPGGDEPMAVGDLAEFRARDVDRPSIPPDAFVVAVDETTDQVIGYACLFVLGRERRRRARHDRGRPARLARPRHRDGDEGGHDPVGDRPRPRRARDRQRRDRTGRCRPSTRRLGYAPRPDELTMRGSVAGRDDVPVSPDRHVRRPAPRATARERDAEATHDAAADETASSPLLLPPDPEAYDAERNVAARARGLAAPYIPGGRDPEPEAGLAGGAQLPPAAADHGRRRSSSAASCSGSSPTSTPPRAALTARDHAAALGRARRRRLGEGRRRARRDAP